MKTIHASYIVSSVIFLCSFSLSGNGYVNGRKLPEILKLDKEEPNTYENQGKYHSTYFIVNPDSSFVYYSVYEVGYDLGIGNYRLNGDTIIFTTDIELTKNAVLDSNIYKKYFKHSSPHPYQMSDEKYIISEKEMHYMK